MWKSLIIAFGTTALWWTTGCGNNCSSACSKAVDECKLESIVGDKEECEKYCKDQEKEDAKETQEYIDCVMKTSCDDIYYKCFAEEY